MTTVYNPVGTVFGRKKSPGPSKPSLFASVKENVAFPSPRGAPSVTSVTLSPTKLALSFDSETRAPTVTTWSRISFAGTSRMNVIVTRVATGACSTNIRGRNTMPRRTMNTIPATIEYRMSFVACGGGLRLRLKSTVAFRGRAIRIDSLQVDGGTSRDRALSPLRRIPAAGIVRAEHVDLDAEFLRQEVRILSEHRELVHGAEPIQMFDASVLQLVRHLLRVRGHLFRAVPHPGLGERLLHEDVHRERTLRRELAGDLVDADFPRRRRVEGHSLGRDLGDLENLPDVREGRLQQAFRGLRSGIDLLDLRVRISRGDDEAPSPVPVPYLLRHVGREGCEDLRLDRDEPARALRLRPVLRSPQIP